MLDEFEPPSFLYAGDKSVRFDRPRRAETAPAIGKGGLLDLFRAWIKKSPQDRRIMPRHPVVSDPVWLGWWRGEDAFFANPARLVNISRGGALLFVTDPPPEGFPAWICLGAPDPNDCLKATVLEVRSKRRRECAVRLIFQEPCPHAFFEAAVCTIPRKPRSGAKSGPSDDLG